VPVHDQLEIRRAVELLPLVAAGEALLEPTVVHLPLADQRVEVVQAGEVRLALGLLRVVLRRLGRGERSDSEEYGGERDAAAFHRQVPPVGRGGDWSAAATGCWRREAAPARATFDSCDGATARGWGGGLSAAASA